LLNMSLSPCCPYHLAVVSSLRSTRAMPCCLRPEEGLGLQIYCKLLLELGPSQGYSFDGAPSKQSVAGYLTPKFTEKGVPPGAFETGCEPIH
jgi:hypothetical protein